MPGPACAKGHYGDPLAALAASESEIPTDTATWVYRVCLVLTCRALRNNIVIIMRAIHVAIRKIGNSQGVVIPKPLLVQVGLDGEAGAEMTVEDGALVLRRPAGAVRAGWAEAARSIAEAGDDGLLMGEFGNEEDSELVW